MKKYNGMYRTTTVSCLASLGLVSGQALAENPGGWEYSFNADQQGPVLGLNFYF